jgi:hypothetical protein
MAVIEYSSQVIDLLIEASQIMALEFEEKFSQIASTSLSQV